jgi:hypothetical protein
MLIGGSSFLCAAGYFMLPAQEMETRAELLRSQRTGDPISDQEIETHLGRLRRSRDIYGLLCIPNTLSGVMVLMALVLLSRVNRPATT